MAHAALLSKVARPSDFSDLLRFGSREDLMKIRLELEKALKKFGSTKSTVVDLLRERLTTIRRAIATA